MRNLGLEENKKVVTKDIDLAINDYYTANENKKASDKIAKENAVIIKDYLNANKLTEYQGTKHSAKISKSTSLEYDDNLLLKVVKNLPEEYQSRLINVVEVVNLEALERLLVTGELNASQFKEAEVEKETIKLYVK